MATCEDEIKCDFAETYHVYDIYSLNVMYMGNLARGLRSNSRTMMKLRGDKLNLTETLCALIYDKVAWLQWAKTPDGAENKNHPKSMYMLLSDMNEGDYRDPDNEYAEFKTGEEFLKAWNDA